MRTEEALAAIDESQKFSICVSSDFNEVEQFWKELEPNGTGFQTRRWLLPWFEIIGRKHRITPLFVTVSDHNTGKPLIFLPLCIKQSFSVRIAKFPDCGVTDYNAPILADDLHFSQKKTLRLWREICQSLTMVDLICFDKMPDMICGSENPFLCLDWLYPIEERAWTVELPNSREEYDKKLRQKDRKEQRRKRKNLVEQVGTVSLIHAGDKEERRVLFDIFVRQRKARFSERKRDDILADPAMFEFYSTVALNAEDPLIKLSALRSETRFLATLVALSHNNSYSLVMHSFSADLPGLSPGIAALDEMATHLINSGVKYFDFTIGNEPYKCQFGTKEHMLYGGSCFLTSRGKRFLQVENMIKNLKKRPFLKPLRMVTSHFRKIRCKIGNFKNRRDKSM